MTSHEHFPARKLEGQHYRIEDPEVEFHGLIGVAEGPHLLIREHGELDRLAEPEELLGVLLAVRHAFKIDIANGKADQIGMVIVPRVGGIALYHTGILKPSDFANKRVLEDEEIITIPDIALRDPLMAPWQRINVSISSKLDAGKIITATAEGDEL